MTMYTAVIALTCISLFSLCVLVSENGRMDREEKTKTYRTYVVIALAALMEWLSVGLNGAPGWTRYLHIAVKALDYILTPVVGMLFVRQISRRDGRNRPLYILIAANTVLQLLSCFLGLTFVVDESNVYRHGPWYPAYVLVYAAIIVIVAVEFGNYSKRFRSANRKSFYLIVLITVLGIVLQEATDGALRTSYLALTISSIFLFIHNSEHNQQQTDDEVLLQRRMLERDELSGLKSRFAYSERLNELNKVLLLPEDMVVFMIDVNGLKTVNDSLGHEAGDELIAGVGDCIKKTFSEYGECYRTGGDEFVVILQAEEKEFPDVLSAILQKKVESWKGKLNKSASVSCGYARASDFPVYSIEKLVSIADERMYEQKAAYYRAEGRDRRRRRTDSGKSEY